MTVHKATRPPRKVRIVFLVSQGELSALHRLHARLGLASYSDTIRTALVAHDQATRKKVKRT